MSLKNIIGLDISAKGKISKSSFKEIEDNKITFCLKTSPNKPESVVFVTIEKNNIKFDIETMDFSKFYVYSGTVTGSNTVEARYLTIAAMQR